MVGNGLASQGGVRCGRTKLSASPIIFMEFEDWFRKYEENLDIGGRAKTFKKSLELLLVKTGDRAIVETGCARMEDDWGAGMSTVLFADFCKEFGAHLYSVDINPLALEMAKLLLDKAGIPLEFVSFVENDSVAFLQDFDQKIDLLYLDSLDVPIYDSPESAELLRSQAHQLREIEASFGKLSPAPIVLLDDNAFVNGGKSRFSKLSLATNGFSQILNGKQSLWTK